MPLSVFILPVTVVLIWSGNILVTKLSAGAVDPGVMVFGRWLVALIIMAPFAGRAAWRERAAIRPHLGKLALLGILGMALNQGAAYYAAGAMSATTLGLFVCFIPLLTMASGAVLLGERPTAGMVGGCLVALFGAAWLLGQGDPWAPFIHGLSYADALMTGGSLAYAIYNVLLKRWTLTIAPWASIYMQVFFAALFLLPLYLAAPAAPPSLAGAGMLLYAGAMTSVIAPYLWMRGLQRLGPARMSGFANLTPVTTAAMAVTLLGEPLYLYHLIGGGLALLGIVIAQWSGRPKPAPLRIREA